MENAVQTQTATVATTPPPGVEPIQLSGGESPASWDELEQLTAKPKAEPKPKEVAKEPKKEKEETEEKVEVKGSKQKKDEAIEKAEQAVKLLKLKHGETALDVAADALVPVKVDGKVVEVPLQEALNRYSQQSHLDKLYKSYKTEKETFDKERSTISEALNKSYDYLVNQKDLRGFIDYLGEAMGVDAQQLYQDAVGNLQKQIEEYSQLSPEERRFKEVEAENAYFKRRMDAQKQAQEATKSKAALESELQGVMDSHGMDKAALVKAWDELTQMGHNPDEITPSFLGSYYSNMQKIDLIEKSLGELSPELGQNAEIVESLATFAIQTEATAEEIQEAIKQIYGETPEKKLSQKVEKNMRANAQKGSKAQKNPGSDPLFFDDI